MKDRMRQKAFIFSRNLSARRAFKSPSSFYRNCANAFSFLVGVHTVYMDIVTFISHYNVLYAVWSWKRILRMECMYLLLTVSRRISHPITQSIQTSNPLSIQEFSLTTLFIKCLKNVNWLKQWASSGVKFL